MTLGDPACDLTMYWTLFYGHSRAIFREILALDQGAWLRKRAWALWKALIVAAGFIKPTNIESNNCWKIIKAITQGWWINWFIGL